MREKETIFHKIIKHEIPADIVFEDEQLIAFKDIAPQAPIHILIVPKKTLPTLSDSEGEDKELLGHMILTAAKIAETLELKKNGYRLVINNGETAGQSVFQLHLHLLGGREFRWPPG